MGLGHSQRSRDRAGRRGKGLGLVRLRGAVAEQLQVAGQGVVSVVFWGCAKACSGALLEALFATRKRAQEGT